jgi:hypothetical protein
LENAVRDQKNQRTALQSKLDQQSAEYERRVAAANESSANAVEQLRIDRATETQQLGERLAAAERVARQRESQDDESLLAAKHLRKILAEAEQKVSARETELTELESRFAACELDFANRLAEAAHQHQVESKHLQSISASAENRAEERKQLIARLITELEQIKADNAQHLRDAAVSFYEKSLAEDAVRRSQSELANEVNSLRSEIDRLHIELEHSERERSPHTEHEQPVQSIQASRIDDLQQQLRAAQDQLRESDADAAVLQEHADELRAVVDLLEEDAAAAELKSRRENDELKQAFQNYHDESEDQATANAAELTQHHKSEIAKLQESLTDYQGEIDLLATEIDQANHELDRKQGALERVGLENERFQDIQGSQFTTMQTRIDQLVVALDCARQECTVAEQEARRLSTSRSQRIAYLSQQRERLLAELRKLREAQQQPRREDEFDAKQLVFEQLGRTASDQAA